MEKKLMLRNKICIIPKPLNLALGKGKFIITNKTIIESDPKLNDVAKFFKRLLKPATGFDLLIVNSKSEFNKYNIVILEIDKEINNLGEEGYFLNINQERILISAPSPAGVFYGIQTLRQLLPIEIESVTNKSHVEWSVPSVEIKDYPRFSWRGYMLDESRHFLGKEVVKRNLDLMALFKMNIFHWHLTDDQGWRIEIKKYPLLIEIGSKRKETQIGGFISKKTDNIPHEGFYTQKDVQEIVAYADKLFIKVIPEIDMPGHSKAVLAAYPELSCTGGPFEVPIKFGIKKDVFCVGKESVFEFIQNVLDEIIQLFPSYIIHIGGDEVPKKRWKECPECQTRIKSESLNNEKELQIYFTNRIITFLTSRDCRVMGWNQILSDKLSEDVIGQYWIFGKKEVTKHLKRGGNIVMSKFGYTYLDYSYSFTSLSKAYRYEPIPKRLMKEYHCNILGIEAPMWTEWVRNVNELDWQTFPRLIAFAETGWTLKEQKNFKNFKKRLGIILKRLDMLGVSYAQKDEYEPHLIKKIFRFFTMLKEPKRRSLY